MEHIEEIFRAGRFPILSGPDRLELALGLVEPVAMGTAREVSFRIQTSRDGFHVQAIRGPVVGIEWGNGNGLYHLVVHHIDGSYAHIRDYSPAHKHCRALTWTNALENIANNWRDRPTNHQASWTLGRDDLVNALIGVGLPPWRSRRGEPLVGVFSICLMSQGQDVRLPPIDEHDCEYHVNNGLMTVRLFAVMRNRDSGELLIQFTDPFGHVFHGVVGADLQLQWIHRGQGWRDSMRLAS